MSRILLAALVAAGLGIGLSTPSFAQSTAMATTCEDYMGMDSDGMESTAAMLAKEIATMDDTDEMAAEDAMALAQDACEANPDGTVGEAVKALQEG